PELWPSIERGLADSEFFLLMASPEAAASKWVKKEIHWWLEHRSIETLLLVFTDGDFRWDEAANDFDWSQTTALPSELLEGKFTTQPLWVDLRRAKRAEELSLLHREFRAAVVDIAATIYGRDKDELDGEDVRQHRRLLLA